MNCPPWPKGKKLVHLDLKGAPPRVAYLHRLIELFSQLGVDGLLVEYEDMFPYKGELKLLQTTSQPAYSREEVLSMQVFARSKGMEVIPLIQTFGHMEFVLKHRPLWHLREVAHSVGTLNPHKEEGVRLVMEMLKQVVELHPGLNTLHIGADEVYMLGEGEESKLWLASSGHTVEQLFLSHVTKVAKAIKEAWPNMSIIMWDDMMRGMSQDTLKASGLVGLVQPMLWDYTPDLDVDKTVSLMEKYYSAGMSDLWAASSFKGSTSVYTCVTSTQRHVDNHLQWLKVAAALSAGVNLKGIAITGWQRYDHLSVLCELMPVALPSLAACLHTLLHGQFSAEAQSKVTEQLGISSVEVEAMERTSAADSLFPGRRLAELIVELNSLLNSEDIRFFEDNMFVRGWFSPYHRQRKAVSPLITMQIQSQVSVYLAMLQQKVEAVRGEMVLLYPDSTAQEWIEEHVSPVTGPLQRITDDIDACLKEMMP
ncbi:hexosaminidase D [Parambassis ranga]|uniref:beta-N-acetylhexosaminidase n=1 Tax=Parambassis ranga TaxID=210632 RepID=A0A6P7IRZ0_9TELE|nr:hexosaminidase D [Parambassis ranga]XP_028263634.1 hexosaminidase D [Parambassis ranga]XP_028263635.1 hexosaminidase D [Parambassis ranga]